MKKSAGLLEKALFWGGFLGFALFFGGLFVSYVELRPSPGSTRAVQIGALVSAFVSPVLMGGAFFLSGQRKDDYMALREGKPVRLSWKIGRWLVLGIVPLITVLSVLCPIAAGSEAGWCVVMVPMMWAYTAPVMVLLGSLTMFLGGRFVT